MPRLPTAESLGQRSRPSPQLGAVAMPHGADTRALAHLGESFIGAADAITKINDKLADARRSADLTDALGRATEAIGTKAIDYQRDQDFKTAPARFKVDADSIGSSIAKDLSDPKVREAFTREYSKLAVSKQLSVVSAAAKQEGDYNVARLGYNLNTFANEAASSGELGKSVAINQAKISINEMKAAGWITDIQAKQYEDNFQKTYFQARRLNDPVGALQELVTNRDKMNPAVVHSLQAELFTAAAPVLAAQVNELGGVGAVDSVANKRSGDAAGKDVAPVSVARGIRNNNPGNIQKSAEKWQGEVDGSDSRYATFASPEAGVRAIGKTLISYADTHGINTVEGVIARWAPATENDTASYVKSVAKSLDVKPDQEIDVKNPAVMSALTKAIIGHENGKDGARVTDAQIKAGLDAALSGTALPKAAEPQTKIRSAAGDPNAKTGIPLVDGLPPDLRMRVLSLAEAQAKEKNNGQREAMQLRVNDAQAAYVSTGNAQNVPTEAELIATFGQVHGVTVARRLTDSQKLGQNIQSMKTLPDAGIESLLRDAKPAEGPGYAARLQDYQRLETAATEVRRSRAADPGAYAIVTGSYGWKPMENLEPDALKAELQNRTRTAAMMSRDYGTAPTVLTRHEAKALAGVLRAGSVEAQKDYLSSVYTGVGADMPLYKLTMAALAPDAPVIAQAGIYQARQARTTATEARGATDVADLILRGNNILNPPPKADGFGHQGGKSLIKMPEDKQLLADWNATTGMAFKGKEQANDLFQQTAKAIYAARSAEEGDYSGTINPKRWKAAIQLATGGIDDYNGSDIVLPYGMKVDAFQDGMKRRVQVLAGAGPQGVTPDEMLRLPLENAGDGLYIFRRGSGYVVDKDGRPVTVNFNDDAPAAVTAPEPTATIGPAYPGRFSVTAGGAVTGLPRRRP